MGKKYLPLGPSILTSTSYDGRHTLEFDEKAHRYKLDGKRVPGATTIGGVYPKGEGLLKWMIDQGPAAYESQDALTKGGGVGTILHAYAEAYEKGETFDMSVVSSSPWETDIRRVIERFRAWRDGNRDKVVGAEDIIASPQLAVGGRIDTLREREGMGLVLSDYKTSKGIYISHLIQVIGGYRRMLREWKNIEVPYVEITCFPKQEEEKTKILLCDGEGWTPNSGEYVRIPGLFGRLERQFERNLGTYEFQEEVENVLTPPYRRKEKAS